MFGRNGDRELDRTVRSMRPEPREEFVGELATRMGAGSRAPRRAGSRMAFAAALTSVFVGAFAAFGGVSYAAAGASDTAETVKRVVQLAGPQERTVSAAQTQYRPGAVAGVAQTQYRPGAVAGVAQEEMETAPLTVAPTVERLPFTGFPLVLGLALGAILTMTGLALRRFEGR